MAGKKIMSGLCTLLAAVVTAAVLWIAVNCRDAAPVLYEVPEDVTARGSELMEALCAGEFSRAEALLHGRPALGADREPGDALGAMVWEAYVRSLDYELVGQPYATDTGIAQNVKLISLELPSATENLGSRAQQLLQQAVDGAEDVSELYDETNGYRQELVMEILYQAAAQVLEEDVRYTYQIFPLQLIFGDGNWEIAADEHLLRAVSGGLSENGAIADKLDMHIHNVKSEALEGILSVDKVYWLHDSDPVAPKPDPEHYGEAADPKELEPVIRQAEKLLNGQELIFKTDTEIREDSTVTWYRDDTILSITWQHSDGKAVYTCSEVVIAHPSQFRRFLSDGEFGSGKLYKATEMAADVNAVTASNGDYYGYRGYGNLVYNGQVNMAENRYLDTCYVDENGDLLFVDMNTLYKKQDLEKFVAENNIRFSLAFGPILVENGKVVAKHHYALGETDRPYSRSALCQIGPLHYLFAVVNRKGRTVTEFAAHLQEMGVPRAYTLDGGQTSTIVMGNNLMNPVDYGGERETSDILYFATAIPEGG